MDYQTAEIGLREGLRYADEIEQSYCRHVMAATSAHVAWAAGRWDEARSLRAEIEIVEPGSRRGTLGSRDALGFVAFGRGDVERARDLFKPRSRSDVPRDEVELILPALWGLAETALVAGEPQVAIGHCEEALELATTTGERALLVPFVVTGVRAAWLPAGPTPPSAGPEQMRTTARGWAGHARPALDHADGLIRPAAGSTVSARASARGRGRGWDRSAADLGGGVGPARPRRLPAAGQPAGRGAPLILRAFASSAERLGSHRSSSGPRARLIGPERGAPRTSRGGR